MSLSVANVIAWDFTAASSPLVSKVGQSETFTVNGGLAAPDTTNGLVFTTGGYYAQLVCTNGGFLSGWTYPYTLLAVFKAHGTGNAAYTSMMYRGPSSADFNHFMHRLKGSNKAMDGLNSGYNYGDAASLATDTETVMTIEFRANGNTVWLGTTSDFANTSQSLTIPTWNTTDVVRLGDTGGNNLDITSFKGFALIPGALTGTDRTNLVADWRAAIGISASTPGRRPRVYLGRIPQKRPRRRALTTMGATLFTAAPSSVSSAPVRVFPSIGPLLSVHPVVGATLKPRVTFTPS